MESKAYTHRVFTVGDLVRRIHLHQDEECTAVRFGAKLIQIATPQGKTHWVRHDGLIGGKFDPTLKVEET